MRSGTRTTWLLAFLVTGCADQPCQEDSDCPGSQICDTTTGECEHECTADEDCSPWTRCIDGTCQEHCVPEELSCPSGMTSVCGGFCMDVWEASRPDATDVDGGSDESMATSRPGVLPWCYEEGSGGVMTHSIAAGACAAAGKRLCTMAEWEATCAELDGRVYVYGDDYDPLTCNSTDTFCDPDCGIYPLCYQDCFPDFRVMPTGSFPACTNAFGILDLSGNLWEAVSSTDTASHYRGGAYNCGDPTLAHQCGYDGLSSFFAPYVKGFRCCADGERP
jgi:hypothetical protein